MVEHSNLGLYYFNNKKEEWTYLETENNRKKQILTASMTEFDAVTIIQDLDPPKVLSMHPGNGGGYKANDVNEIRILVNDRISGIEPNEESFSLSINNQPVFFAYQPIKKEVSYKLEKTLTQGPHQIDFTVFDRLGNKTSRTVFFSIY